MRSIGLRNRGTDLLAAATTFLLLSSFTSAPVQATPDPSGLVILAAEQQPRAQRPTLDRLKHEAASKGISLEQAVDAYVAEKARTDPSATANWPDGPVSIPDVKIDDLTAVQLDDLKEVAKTQHITFAEAIARHGSWPRLKNEVIYPLERALPGELAGIVRAADGGSIWIGFKGTVPSQALELAKRLEMRVEMQGQLGYSEIELEQAQNRVHQTLLNDPATKNVTTYYDAKTGTIKALVVPVKSEKSSATADSFRALAAPMTGNPAINVSLELAKGPLDVPADNYIRGGGNVLRAGSAFCTSNFNVISPNGTTRRLGMAGHCAQYQEALSYCNQSADGGCTTVHYVNHYLGPGGDLGIYDHGTMTATRTFYWDWGGKRYADAESPGPEINDVVCKFGFTTGRSCGTVTAKNLSSGLVGGLVATSTPFPSAECDHGDSGGPYYEDATAYGILHGGIQTSTNSPYYCSFTPVNRYTNWINYHVWTR
ncbi:MAG: trypsin-like serine protease [Nonomuraea sp.]|nr:trypsin-like serine protease [Nonomuraea sp.]